MTFSSSTHLATHLISHGTILPGIEMKDVFEVKDVLDSKKTVREWVAGLVARATQPEKPEYPASQDLNPIGSA